MVNVMALTRMNGRRVLVNWDNVAYITPTGESELSDSLICFNTPHENSHGALIVEVHEGIEVIEGLLGNAAGNPAAEAPSGAPATPAQATHSAFRLRF